MAYGMQFFDSSGNKILDTTEDRVAKFLGSASLTPGTAGNTGTIAAFANGTPWYFVRELNYSFFDQQDQYNRPTLSFSSNTIYWTWPDGGNSALTLTLIYGIF